jgi:hypothetical protein
VTGPTETLQHLDVDPALRPLARAMAVRGAGWWTVLRMELRKTVDTRASRWVLAAVLALAVGAMAYELLDVRSLAASDPSAVTFPRYLDNVFDGVALLLPVVGVLAMTSEWSQRTALSTFTLVPRRGRVLSAKVVAALVVVVVAALVCSLVALAATVLASQVAGVPLVVEGGAAAVLQTVVATVLTTSMAVGLGALAGSTPVGVVAFYALPLGFAVAAPRVLGEAAVWLDGLWAFERLAEGTVTSWPQTGTAVAVWVLLPLVAGVARCLRREVS